MSMNETKECWTAATCQRQPPQRTGLRSSPSPRRVVSQGAHRRHLGVRESPHAPLLHVGPVSGHLLGAVAPAVLEERRGKAAQVLAVRLAFDAAKQRARIAHAHPQHPHVIVHPQRRVQGGVALVRLEREARSVGTWHKLVLH